MSLSNDELEQQLLQLADALAKMSEMTASAFEDRDQQIQTLQEKIEALESQLTTERPAAPSVQAGARASIR